MITCGKVRVTDIMQSSCAMNRVHVVQLMDVQGKQKHNPYKIVDVKNLIRIYHVISNKRLLSYQHSCYKEAFVKKE